MLLGFYEKNRNGRRIAGHGGDSQFFHSSLDLFVDEGVGVYVVVNSSGRDGGAGALLSRFMAEFTDRYYPAPAVEDTVTAQMAAEHARLLAGTYMSSRRQESNFFSALGVLSQIEVTIDGDGGLLVPALTDIHGEPMKWREVAPFVWHHVEGRERLAARVRNGRVELLGVDSVSPFLVLQPAPWWKSSAIFLPLLTGALAVIVGMLVAWPVTVLLRRHYRLWPLHAGPGEWPYRWARAGGAVAIGLLAAWMAVFSQVSGNIFAYAPEADPWIALLKAGTLLVCAGGNGRRPMGLAQRPGPTQLAVAGREPAAGGGFRHRALARRGAETRRLRDGLLRGTLFRPGKQESFDRVLNALVVSGFGLGVDAFPERTAGLGA